MKEEYILNIERIFLEFQVKLQLFFLFFLLFKLFFAYIIIGYAEGGFLAMSSFL